MNKESRLAEIYRSELKDKGLISALISASNERRKENADIRRFLPKSGLAGAAFEKMFGKPYRYGSSVRETRGPNGSSESGFSKSVEVKIERVGVNSRLTAKNTMVLPAMARDMNLMRMNMQKMVKLSGGTPSNKADMFFKRASDREKEYESAFSKYSPSKASSSKSESSGNTLSTIGGFLGGIFSLVGSALSGAGSILSSLIPAISGFFGGLVKALILTGILGLAINQMSPETREKLKRFLIDALIAFFNGIKAGFTFIKDLLSDEGVKKSFHEAIQAMVDAVVAAFKLAMSTPIDAGKYGKYTLGEILGATILALAAFKAALFAVEIAMLRLAFGGGRGRSGPAGAADRGKGMSRTGKLAVITGLGLTLYDFYNRFGGKEKAEAILNNPNTELPEEIFSGASGELGVNASNPSANSNLTQQQKPKASITENVMEAGELGLRTFADWTIFKWASDKFSTNGAKPPPKFDPSNKPLTQFGSVGERREAVKNKPLYERMARLIKKIVEKIGTTKLIGFIWQRLSWSIATKLTAVVAGVAAAPISAGASLLISAIGAGLLAYDVYQIVDFLVRLAKEIDVTEEDTTPERVDTQTNQVQTAPNSPAPEPVPAPVPSPSPSPSSPSQALPSSPMMTADGGERLPLERMAVISSPFGTRKMGMHYGTDFAVPVGTKVLAPQSGTIVDAGYNDKRGNYVEIVSGKNSHLLLHMSKLNVEKGQTIQMGQQVGLSGNTGNSTGPHLHWSKRVNGRPVDAMLSYNAPRPGTLLAASNYNDHPPGQNSNMASPNSPALDANRTASATSGNQLWSDYWNNQSASNQASGPVVINNNNITNQEIRQASAAIPATAYDTDLVKYLLQPIS